MTAEEFNDALRVEVAGLTASHYGIDLPEPEATPELRVSRAINKALLGTYSENVAARVLRCLGEVACDDGG